MISRLFKSRKNQKPGKKKQSKKQSKQSKKQNQNKLLRDSSKNKAIQYGDKYRCCFHLSNGNRCNKNALGKQKW